MFGIKKVCQGCLDATRARLALGWDDYAPYRADLFLTPTGETYAGIIDMDFTCEICEVSYENEPMWLGEEL